MTIRRECAVRVLLVLFPLAFFAVNRAWMYSTQDYPDAWMYTGYFLHPELLYPRMPEAYQGARVLHIFPGWLANHWLPVAQAIFVQKALIFYAEFWLWFGWLKQMFRSELAALIGAMLGVTSGLMLYLLSWNYVFNTVPLLLLGTLWAQSRMRDAPNWPAWALLAGAFFVGGVSTYLRMAFMAPMVFALFVHGLPERTWRNLWRGLGWAALGGVLSMLVQGIISVLLGGSLWYFMPQVVRGLSYLQEDWFVPLEYWWRQATWLVFLGFVAVLAGAAIWKGGGAAGQPRRLLAPRSFVAVVFLAGLVWYGCIHAVHLDEVLQTSEQASFLYPLAWLVLGGWLAWLLEGLEDSQALFVVAVSAGGILLVYGWLGRIWPARAVLPWALLFFPAAGLAGLAGAGAKPWRAFAAALVFVGALTGMNIYLAPRAMLDPRLLERNIAFNQALYETVRTLDQWDREKPVWLWYGLDRPNGRIHRLLSYFYLWNVRDNRSVLGERFPGLVGGVIHSQAPLADRQFQLPPGRRVVMFDVQPQELAAVQQALAKRGVGLAPLAKVETPAIGAYPPMRMELWESRPLPAKPIHPGND